ncbi:hypothetical protein PG984_006635 [Apiospora sp. TS-2023a]
MAIRDIAIWPPEADRPVRFIKDLSFYTQSEGSPTLVTETDPAAHRTVRKAVDKGFGVTCITEYARIVQNITKHLVRQLRNQSRDDPKGVDVKAWSARVTFDVITEVTFGKSFETVARGEHTVWLSLLTDNIAAAAVGVTIRQQPRVVKALLRFLFSKLSKKAKARALDDYLSFLEGQAASLVSGGTETSSTLMTSLIYNLLMHPDKLARLQEEVRQMFPRSEDINVDSVKQAFYLQAVIEEGLRIFPPVAFGLPRVCPGTTIGGVYVPEGTIVQSPGILMARHESYFARAKEFLPERWLPVGHLHHDEQFAHDRKEASRPFSLGPRQCIGTSLAYTEWRLVLAELVWRFDWELVGARVDLMKTSRLRLLWEMPPARVRFIDRKDLPSE